MSPWCVEFSDGTLWVGMAEDARQAGGDAANWWHYRNDHRGVPTFSVYHLEIDDDNVSD